jgi:uncharacterized RDD family membrane protein YckC
VTNRFEAWLAGGNAAAPQGTNAANGTPKKDQPDDDYPGQRYELAPAGPGSLAGLGRRLLALIIDIVLATLVTSLFVRPASLQPAHVQALNSWSLVTWLLITVVGTAFFAATPGMTVLGLRLARVDGGGLLLPLRAIVRAVLIAVVVPAVIWDGDRRGLHDKAAGTIVVSIR